VARFEGVVSETAAENLARIGGLEADEMATLRSTNFAKTAA
jgi:hypothetical protein